jgi:hypothetical protein
MKTNQRGKDNFGAASQNDVTMVAAPSVSVDKRWKNWVNHGR